ncbi:MAG: hypothetical protein IJN49_08965 [Clostridia bacterium]|nr:hypothetical protein [Clostridia bacterium]
MTTDYQKLLEKYLRLKEESEQLKTVLAEHNISIESTTSKLSPVTPQNVVTVNNSSSADDKLNLYMSLFIGRTDVYAKRWVSRKNGKTGYSPVCKNEWDEKRIDYFFRCVIITYNWR